MDEIIYLELDEEIPSVIDKIKGLSGKTIALVIPKGASIIQSVINLKILKEEAKALKKDIVLVTQDKIGRNLASQVGLSVYDSIRSSRPVINPVRSEPEPTEIIELDLSEKPSQPPKGVSVHDYQESTNSPVESKPLFEKKKVVSTSSLTTDRSNISGGYKPTVVTNSQVSKKKKIIKIFIIIILLIATAIAIYFYLPSAKVNLTLQSESFDTDVEIAVDNNINKINEERNAIPGELIEVEIEEVKTYSATGTKDLGEKAGGTIKLSNGTGVEQSLVAGTTFTANGLSFVSTETVTVSKATASVDAGGNVVKTSGTATVKVQAAKAGDKYNIGTTSFSVNASVSAESTSAMSGGVSKKIKIVTGDDINNAKNEIKNIVVEKNLKELVSKIGDKKYVDSTIVDEEIAFSSSKTINSEADSFEVRLTVKSRLIAYNENDYRKIVTIALNKNVPNDKEVILSEDDKVATVSGNADFSTGILKLDQNIKTHVGPKINENDIIKKIVGKKQPEAETQLREIDGVKSVDVQIKPSWWPKTLPRLKGRIKVERKVEK